MSLRTGDGTVREGLVWVVVRLRFELVICLLKKKKNVNGFRRLPLCFFLLVALFDNEHVTCLYCRTRASASLWNCVTIVYLSWLPKVCDAGQSAAPSTSVILARETAVPSCDLYSYGLGATYVVGIPQT